MSNNKLKPQAYFDLARQLTGYWLSRNIGLTRTLPTNLTLNVSFRCNSACLTCNVTKRKVRELTLDEWKKIFRKSKLHPFWLIISGGEPFLKPDLVPLIKSAYKYFQPAVINITTNGILTEIIPQKAEQILKSCPHSQIVINFSLDGIGQDHDKIRGIPGNFPKLLKSYQETKKLKEKYNNLTIGVHTVVSKFNDKKIGEISEFALSLHPDQYISEIAEERVELLTKGLSIAPSRKDYQKAISSVEKKIARTRFTGLARMTEALRARYYRLVQKTLLKKTQVIPCYAGLASAQISAEGEVWPCCVRADNFGNLRDCDYDFAKIWFGSHAQEVRRSIKNKNCFCPLASAAYTSMLLDLRSVLKIFQALLK